jgi:hypothetical protein
MASSSTPSSKSSCGWDMTGEVLRGGGPVATRRR